MMDNYRDRIKKALNDSGCIGTSLLGAYQGFSSGDTIEGLSPTGEAIVGMAGIFFPPLGLAVSLEATGRAAINTGYGVYIAHIKDETNRKMLEGYGRLLI